MGVFDDSISNALGGLTPSRWPILNTEHFKLSTSLTTDLPPVSRSRAGIDREAAIDGTALREQGIDRDLVIASQSLDLHPDTAITSDRIGFLQSPGCPNATTEHSAGTRLLQVQVVRRVRAAEKHLIGPATAVEYIALQTAVELVMVVSAVDYARPEAG